MQNKDITLYKIYNFLYSILVASTILLCPIGANANVFDEEEEEEFVIIHDPYEKWNRKVHSFNKVIDKYTLKPVAKGYNKFPKPIKRSVRNFTNNIGEPLTVANSILQLDFKNTYLSLSRFVINTTAGVLGLFDVATKWGVLARKEDFGQTMGKYGVGAGPYLVIPFLGPSNIRDIFGRGVDAVGDPVWHIDEEPLNELYFRITVKALDIIDERASLLDTIDEIEKNAIDPYTIIKSAYSQRRKAQIENLK